MSEKSGIDMISDLISEVKLLRKELKIIDQNVKKIANSAKIAEIANKVIDTPLSEWARSTGPKPKIESVDPSVGTIRKENLRFNFEPLDASKINQQQPNRATRTSEKPTACMCHGKMVAEFKGASAPISGLSVKIFDDKDNLIKETKTNKAGIWMSQLPVGNYVANIEGQFNGKDLYPVNLAFVVEPGIKELEVK